MALLTSVGPNQAPAGSLELGSGQELAEHAKVFAERNWLLQETAWNSGGGLGNAAPRQPVCL